MRESLATSPAPVTARALLTDAPAALGLTVVAGAPGLGRPITHPRIQKSGLALAGHMVGVVPSRLQILGETELSFLETLPPDERARRVRSFFALGLCGVVVTRGVPPLEVLVDAADTLEVPLLSAAERSSGTIAGLHAVLDRLLAPRSSMHGVLVEVHGLGLLLVGPSGIGKSECALVVVERGHLLVADDRVDLVRVGDRAIGSAPMLLRHHLEIRGLGILNVRDLFGATAVRDESAVDLLIELRSMGEGDAEIDRLGLDDETTEILGLAIPTLRIPVHPGRDMGVLLEVAARNQLLRRAGHHSARAFAGRLAAGLGLKEG